MMRFPRCESARIVLILVAMAVLSSAEDREAGKNLFQNRCGGCHAADRDGIGPRLRGVLGRTAGAVRTFHYSDALKSAHLIWDAPALDKWLRDTESVVPDNDMSFRLESQTERTAIIEYLRTLGAH